MNKKFLLLLVFLLLGFSKITMSVVVESDGKNNTDDIKNEKICSQCYQPIPSNSDDNYQNIPEPPKDVHCDNDNDDQSAGFIDSVRDWLAFPSECLCRPGKAPGIRQVLHKKGAYYSQWTHVVITLVLSSWTAYKTATNEKVKEKAKETVKKLKKFRFGKKKKSGEDVVLEYTRKWAREEAAA